jgi:hypothetical protein
MCQISELGLANRKPIFLAICNARTQIKSAKKHNFSILTNEGLNALIQKCAKKISPNNPADEFLLVLQCNGKQGTKLLKSGVSSLPFYGEQFTDVQVAVWNKKFADLQFSD